MNTFYIHNKHRQEKTATEDITCYKVVYLTAKEKVFESRFNDTKWDFRKKNVINIDKLKPVHKLWSPYCELATGIDSYTSLKGAKSAAKVLDGSNLGTVAYWNKRHPTDRMVAAPLVVLKLVIPKGAKYYYNPQFKEYVSDTIKLPK